jgi:hypothetical protein
MMAKAAKEQLDVDDAPPPKKPPKHCPWCGGEVVKRWVPNHLRWLSQSPRVRASFVCLKCKIGVRTFKIPPRPLFTTKKAAAAEAQRDHDELVASGFQSKYTRDLYARGVCGCVFGPLRARQEPCAIHAPLRRQTS